MMSTEGKSKEFTCATCGGTFAVGPNEADAIIEAWLAFGEPVTPETHSPVCSDCYEQFMLWFQKSKH